jgi:hypothetical protein
VYGAKRMRGLRTVETYRYEFDLDMTPEEYLDYYRGILKCVMVRSTGGQTVQFPASLLHPFLLPAGIRGHFVLTCDEHHKQPKLTKVE